MKKFRIYFSLEDVPTEVDYAVTFFLYWAIVGVSLFLIAFIFKTIDFYAT